MTLWLLLVSVLGLTAHGQKAGLPYFYLQEGQAKCFLEDVVEGIPLTVTYANEENPGVPCSIQFKDPSKRVVLSRHVTHDNPSGKVSYLVKQSGEHNVCVQCDSTQWFSASQLKWTLSIDIGDTELNLPDIAKMHHLEDLDAVLKHIKNKLQVLTAENEYQKLQEEGFRDMSEAMNTRVVLFAVIQIVVLVAVTIFSVLHLSRYFHAQKLY